MGSRDFRKREPKKAKKDAKKSVTGPVMPTSPSVEVVKKNRKKGEEEEE
jgi:hypothetical protein